jgi:hypothetical protein
MNTYRRFGSVSTEQVNYHVTLTFLWEHGSLRETQTTGAKISVQNFQK